MLKYFIILFKSLFSHSFIQSTDSSVAEPTDITSYNPLPDVQVPREVYIDDDLERTLDNIQKLDFSNIEDDLDNFRLKEPQINADSESVKTEGMLKLTNNQLNEAN